MPSGSKPGEHRGGRKAGTPNRSSYYGFAVAERLKELGVDPIDILAKEAANKQSDPRARIQAASTLLEYVASKRKATDVQSDGDEGVTRVEYRWVEPKEKPKTNGSVLPPPNETCADSEVPVQ